ncbi:DNA (cytosine-5)-methyltransferase 1 [Pseudoalteromonas translucida KMM 520]|uniref:Cytosine-specific methyltransferase n=1 Tax=Pseudoalteromonas translucida KMM 520 TaxID=1315283 RepID=A0A0U2X3Y8_9GAMM|nr:DNA cytosine methyltransferase [Pseudoalteromonas translucida]ALS34633.1 DNA (cytosine-5)-methyltransferase 1 [Pseudoalteromonas translucida KMM 520]
MVNGEILVIDLFAGPGGLGEGISAAQTSDGKLPFQIGISVEKDVHAHQTLTTRAFYRTLKTKSQSLNNYYRYLHGEITRDELFKLHPDVATEANKETLNGAKELGKDNKLIHKRIKELVKKHKGPKVLIGGPPCQAYSLAGRSRNAGNKSYIAEDDARHFLYKEYLEVICLAKPDIFVMENVRGILTAKVNGQVMFPQILEDLRSPGSVTKHKKIPKYKVYSLVVDADNPEDPQYKDSADFLIRCEQYGIPQARHRVILLGVREDIKATPETLKLCEHQVTVEQVISDLPNLRSGFSKQKDNAKDWETAVTKNAAKLKVILTKQFNEESANSLNLLPKIGLTRKEKALSNKAPIMPEPLKSWYIDPSLKVVLNHETRGHMVDDLLRYSYCAAYAKIQGLSPKSRHFPQELAPAHANWNTGTHSDRFRVQVANKYATTVTSHISKDGHYFVHYDPQQCRSLSVREAARIQTFPDNYIFEGTRTNQYVQVGNAVPPYLAQQIGGVIIALSERGLD